jgi:hypothetical protein
MTVTPGFNARTPPSFVLGFGSEAAAEGTADGKVEGRSIAAVGMG